METPRNITQVSTSIPRVKVSAPSISGLWLGYKVAQFFGTKATNEFTKRYQDAYNQHVDDWIDKSFPKSLGETIKGSKEVEAIKKEFKFISDRRAEQINKTFDLLKTTLEAHGVKNDPDIESKVLQSAQSGILLGEKNKEEGLKAELEKNVKNAVAAHNEVEIKQIYSKNKLSFTPEAETVRDLLIGQKKITNSDIEIIETGINLSKSEITEKMNHLLADVKSKNTDNPDVAKLSSFEDFLAKHDVNIDKAQDLFIDSIKKPLIENLEAQINYLMQIQRSINVGSPELKQLESKKQSLNIMRFNELEALKRENKDKELNSMLQLAKTLYNINISKIISEYENYNIEISSLPKFDEIPKKEIIKIINDEINKPSTQDYKNKTKHLIEILNKETNEKITPQLSELLSTNPKYINELKAKLTDAKEKFEKILEEFNSLLGPNLQRDSFNKVATNILERDYDKLQRFTLDDVDKILQGVKKQSHALQLAINKFKAENPSWERDAKDAMTKTGETVKEVGSQFIETLANTWSEAASATASAIFSVTSDALNLFGLGNIPVDEKVRAAYEKALKSAEEKGITSVERSKKGTYLEILSIEDEYQMALLRYQLDKLSESEIAKRFNNRIKIITKMIYTEIKKQESTPIQPTFKSSAEKTIEEPPLTLHKNTKEYYQELLKMNKIETNNTYPLIDTLWTDMDKFYKTRIPDREDRKTKLRTNILKPQTWLMNASAMKTREIESQNTMKGKAENFFTAVTTAVGITPTIETPDNLKPSKAAYDSILAKANAAGLSDFPDFETLQKYAFESYSKDPSVKEESKIDHFTTTFIPMINSWIVDRIAMQNLVKH